MKQLLFVVLLLAAAIPLSAQEAGWIGINIEDQKDRGAVIRNVERNSPAAKAGLKEGDVIVQYNKQDVIGVQQLNRLVRETPVGRMVEVKVRRDNRDQTFQVTTEGGRERDRLGRFELDVPGFHIRTDRMARDFPRIEVNTTYVQSGIRVEQLTDQLRDFFGVLSNSGVLVASVEPDSAAAKSGLKAGDVITSVDGRNIRTPSEFSREMRQAGSKPALKIFRDRQEREIKIN